RSHDPGRKQRELVGGAVDNQRVAGVMAALEAHDDIRLLAQPVDDFAFAFIAPLGTDHHDIRHRAAPSWMPTQKTPARSGQGFFSYRNARRVTRSPSFNKARY